MNSLPKIVPDNHGMLQLAELLKELLPEDFGFTLLVFPYGEKNNLANYVSSAHRDDMLAFMQETLNRLRGDKDIKTPNMN